MKYLTLDDVLSLHSHALKMSGGNSGIRDLGLLESALAQPRATFNNQDLNSALVEKAGALTYSIIKNHAFVG